jgi:uncharacterized protein
MGEEDDVRMARYGHFHLVLMVGSECNLRCDYCYVGRMTGHAMPRGLGEFAIDRAIRSLRPGGTLELGFFGGEPLLHTGRILHWAACARCRTKEDRLRLRMSLTTNGTICSADAWQVLSRPDVEVAVSFDGLPEVHDRHRRTAGGEATSATVLATLGRLVDAGRSPRVVMVVRPDSADALPAGLRFLREKGVTFVEPSLDLWTAWTQDDVYRLSQAAAAAADVWKEKVGHFGVGCFDTMAARLAGLPIDECARCAYGAGEIAVSPRGHLYPCERLIGEDREDNPQRLAGHAGAGRDFLSYQPQPARSLDACRTCTIRDACSTTCRCSNFVRTGDVARPDGLLCQWNKIVYREVTRVVAAASQEGAYEGKTAPAVASEPMQTLPAPSAKAGGAYEGSSP